MTADTAPHVLVLFESKPNGAKALRDASELIARVDGELTVATVAPQECGRCCDPGAEPRNCAVRDEAVRELREARQILGPVAFRATFRVLIGQQEPASTKGQLATPVALWVEQHGFDIVFLPMHALRLGGHYAARKLRQSTEADIRLVG